jgi:biopolymer transport protein ExbB
MKRYWIVMTMAAMVSMGFWYSAVAQTTGATSAAATTPLRVESRMTLWDLIKSGGWAMYPLGTCSVLVVWLTILNFQRVNTKKMMPVAVITQIKSAASVGDLQQVWNLSTSTDSFFTRTLAAGLRQIQPEDPIGSRPKVEAAISETASREESRYGFFVNFLALLTSMSPMWGLLGTVSGMIGAFSKIGSGGMGKPEILAKNIGEALVCTASGLMIAIAAMGFYFFFRNVLNSVMKESEGHFTEVLDHLTGGGGAFAQQPAEAEAQPQPKA